MSTIDLSWYSKELKLAFVELKKLKGEARLLQMEKIDALRRKRND